MLISNDMTISIKLEFFGFPISILDFGKISPLFSLVIIVELDFQFTYFDMDMKIWNTYLITGQQETTTKPLQNQ